MIDSAYRGTRVLEVVSGHAAGLVGRFFGDLGAEVIRIELPERRPENAADAALVDWGRLRKRTLRPADPGAANADFGRLVAGADLVVTDLAPQRWASDFPAPEAVSAAHPGLVFLDITPFGRSGPYIDYRASHLVDLAIGGYLYFCGLNSREPLRIGVDMVETLTGVNATGGAMIALRHARATGQGQVIDVTRMDSVLASGLSFPLTYAMAGAVRRRSPTPLVGVGALNPCADGHVFLSTYRQPSAVLAVMLQDERILEARFETPLLREMNQQEMLALFAEAFAARTKAEIFHTGQELRLQNAMVQTPAETPACPQHAHRRFFQPMRLATGQELPAPSLPSAPVAARDAQAHAGPDLVAEASWRGEHEPARPPVASPPKRALEGLKVVELTFAWAGPFMGRILADYGAEVVKIESSHHPDTARGADLVDYSFGENDRWMDRCVAYMIANPDKYHMGMELTDAVGKEVLFDLVRRADVLIENFTPRVLPNLGLGWDVFKELNPNLVMISATGFGQQGPYRDYGAWGWGLECQAGVTYSTGYRGGDPLCFIPTIPDSFSATLGLTAVLAALEERRRTGKGQHIDLSQYECATFATLPEILRVGVTGEARPRLGNRHPWQAPQGVYPCAGRDAWVAIAVSTDGEWQTLCKVMGRDDLAGDASLATHEGRQRAHDRIDEAIAAWTAGRDKREAMETLQAAGVPAGAVQHSKDLLSDPQVLHEDYFRLAEATETGLRLYPGTWHRMQATPAELRRGPSNYGEDNERVLRDVLGYSDARVREALASGALSPVQEGLIRPATPGLPVEVMLEREYILSWDGDYRAVPARFAARKAAKELQTRA